MPAFASRNPRPQHSVTCRGQDARHGDDLSAIRFCCSSSRRWPTLVAGPRSLPPVFAVGRGSGRRIPAGQSVTVGSKMILDGFIKSRSRCRLRCDAAVAHPRGDHWAGLHRDPCSPPCRRGRFLIACHFRPPDQATLARWRVTARRPHCERWSSLPCAAAFDSSRLTVALVLPRRARSALLGTTPRTSNVIEHVRRHASR